MEGTLAMAMLAWEGKSDAPCWVKKLEISRIDRLIIPARDQDNHLVPDANLQLLQSVRHWDELIDLPR